MYPSRPGLMIGFHGCEEAVRDDIISDKTMLKPSQNKYDWLGAGFYFWEGNYTRALDFATNPPGKKHIKHPAVLGAVLVLQYCLDLMDAEFIRQVTDSFHNLKEYADMFNKDLPLIKV